MTNPWTAAQHVQMHWRPDAITKTGVIQPMWVRQVSPVDMARHTIDPFIASVRGAGPAVAPYPSPANIAYAAAQLAKRFAQGQGGVIAIGTEKVAVSPNQPPIGGLVGTIVAAAQQLARNGTATIQVGAQRLIVNNGPGGQPQVRTADTLPTRAGVRAEAAAAAAPQSTSVSVRETPMTAEQQKSGGFGMPMMANTVLPQRPSVGGVPAFPYLDYGYAYRKLNYDDNVWARRNFQAKLAAKFAPQPVAQMHAANRDAIQYAQAQAAVPLTSRAPMVQQRWPHPEAVWPRNASINVRKEQR